MAELSGNKPYKAIKLTAFRCLFCVGVTQNKQSEKPRVKPSI